MHGTNFEAVARREELHDANPQYSAAKNALSCTSPDTPSLEKRAFGRVKSAARSLATHTSVPLMSGLTLPGPTFTLSLVRLLFI
jgi:hypothetical protein